MKKSSPSLFLLLAAFSASVAVALIVAVILWPSAEDSAQSASKAGTAAPAPTETPEPQAPITPVVVAPSPAIVVPVAQPVEQEPVPAPAPAPSPVLSPSPIVTSPMPEPVVIPSPVVGSVTQPSPAPQPSLPSINAEEQAIRLATQEVIGRNYPDDQRRLRLYSEYVEYGKGEVHSGYFLRDMYKNFPKSWWKPLEAYWDPRTSTIHQIAYVCFGEGRDQVQLVFTRDMAIRNPGTTEARISSITNTRYLQMYRATLSADDHRLASVLGPIFETRNPALLLLLADRLRYYDFLPGRVPFPPQAFNFGRRDKGDQPNPPLDLNKYPFDSQTFISSLLDWDVLVDLENDPQHRWLRGESTVLVLMDVPEYVNKPQTIIKVLKTHR